MNTMVNPKKLFTRNRLDLIIKYLYAKEILEKENNDYCTNCCEDLYIRHILMRTGGVEPVGLHGINSDKKEINDYIEQFKNLIFSIKNNGYNQSFPVPVDANMLLGNGAHRIAAAAILNKEIAVENIEQGYAWDFNWFCENGFNTEDKQRILKGYVDIKSENSIIFVVWKPLFKYIDNIKTIISNYFDIVGDVELNFESNYIAFINSLLEIYEKNIAQSNGDNETILEKAHILMADELSYKIIVVTNESKNYDKSTAELAKQCKNEIRNFFNHILPKECFCTVHSSDGKEETVYLSNILLSPNNIEHLKMRSTTEPGVNFVSRIRNLPAFLRTLEISNPNDICVIGSGVMTALGIQKDSDSDFITDYKYRDKLGWNIVYLNDDYDIGISDKAANRPKNISDNILIHNDEYHFWFKGIKFANLELIKDRKRISARPKDLVHLRQIELFEKMQGHFNQQKILMERIQQEQLRRQNLNKPAVAEDAIQTNKEDIQDYQNMQLQPEIKRLTVLEKIFSVRNEYFNNKKHKVFNILGIKAKFKRHV